MSGLSLYSSRQAIAGVKPMYSLEESLASVILRNGLDEFHTGIELRRHKASYADVRVFLRQEMAASQSSIASMIRDLQQSPEVASAKIKGATISVRLADSYLEFLGRELERGSATWMGPLPNTDWRRYFICFLSPNSSKALHLGHLRNILTGNALASALAYAGVKSESYSIVGDIGRSVCEAMAGYRLFHESTDSHGRPELKPDHFVGRCYQDYLRHMGSCSSSLVEVSDNPCGREYIPTLDLADNFLRLWQEKDLQTRNLWQSLCDLVEKGHNQTLARLGVRVDRFRYESVHVQDALNIIDYGLRCGVLKKLNDGTVVYDTGREEYQRIVLLRSDGFPTEHGRIMSAFRAAFLNNSERCIHIDLNGAEWEPALRALKELMHRLQLIPSYCIYKPEFHGMLCFDGKEISSRNQDPILIDALLDELLEHPQVTELAESSNGTVEPHVIVGLVLKGFFLCPPVSKPMTYSKPRLLDMATNRGWLIARAWCRAQSTREQICDDTSPLSLSYRLAVVQSHDFCRKLDRAIRHVQLSSLTGFLVNFCASYITAAPSYRLNKAASTILGATLQCLGCFSPSPEAHMREVREPNTTITGV